MIVSDAGKPFAIDELDNYATRKHPKVLAWLARHPRWTFHFTPTSASWLNAVENFFSKMTRQHIRRGVFRFFLWGKVLSMMPAATAGQVLMLTPIGGFVLSTLIFGGAVTGDVLLSDALIVGGIFVTLRR